MVFEIWGQVINNFPDMQICAPKVNLYKENRRKEMYRVSERYAGEVCLWLEQNVRQADA